MKLVILAAGEGTRLRPLTEEKPKCMVELFDRPMIDHILSIADSFDFSEIVVIGGYKFDVLKEHLKNRDITFIENEQYQSTNMVETLMCAQKLFNEDIVISYSDIVYKKAIVEALINENSDVAVSIDLNWLSLWQCRMENVLDDVESLKLDSNNNIVDIGQKVSSLDEIDGQYIGLIKIQKSAISKLLEVYHKLSSNKKIYMTDLLQEMIKSELNVKASTFNGGWFEVDTIEDKKNYELNYGREDIE